MDIPFNVPYYSNNESSNLDKVLKEGRFSGDKNYSRLCEKWLENKLGSKKALLTPSCTHALEMAAILANIVPGDEIIMPSFTFVSTANAFVLRGGVPVFIDIRSDTLNIDESLIEAAITDRTKAIVPVHYAGIGCNMNNIMQISDKYNIYVIEDAAQGIMSTYKGMHLGNIGHLGALSFHETKNIHSGEGGALLINNEDLIERAEIIREKGTNRSKFFRGEVDKYTWVDIGSSYLPNELTSAFLYAQMEMAELITAKRIHIWQIYSKGFKDLSDQGMIKIPFIPQDCTNNAHMFYLLTNNLKERMSLIEYLKKNGIHSVFHYVPLHSSVAGKKYGRLGSKMVITDSVSDRILRLPLYYSITDDDLNYIINIVKEWLVSG